MKFRPKTENELAILKDDALIAYAVKARDAGRHDEFVQAIGIFIIRREPMVVAMVADRVPAGAVEDVTQEVLASALESLSSIKGVATGQVVNWLKTIVSFRIADFHRKLEKRLPVESIDGNGQGDDEDHWVIQLIDPDADGTGKTEVLMLFTETVNELKPPHQRVVMLRIADYPSKEVSEIINDGYRSGEIESDGKSTMSPANVDKIYSRFKETMDGKLGRGGAK